MNRRNFLKSCLSAAGAAAFGPVASAGVVFSNKAIDIRTPMKKTNVVFILADDLGYSDLGCFQNPADPNYIDTSHLDFSPNIDSIAANGVRLTNFYAHPVCTPTRFCALSGLYLKRSSVFHDLSTGGVLHASDDNKGFNEHSIADPFKAAGYTTACIGKWHLGDGTMLQTNYPPTQPFSTTNPYHPDQAGFDYYYGFLGGSIDYEKHYVRGKTFDWFENRTMLWTDDGSGGNSHADEGKYASHLLTEKAVNFINAHANKHPFFLYVPFVAPHWSQTAIQDELHVHQLPKEEEIPPGQPGHDPALYRKYLSRSDAVLGTDDTDIRKRLIAMVSAMDDGIGEILQSLRNHGIEENTVVVFVGDNGGEQFYPDYTSVPYNPNDAIHYGSNNYPGRDDKATLYDGGIRVPAIFQWKGHLPTGQTTSQLASVIDLKLTIGRLAGLDMNSYPTDGVDLGPNLNSPANHVTRDLFSSSKFFGKIYRKDNWKYVRRHNKGNDLGIDELYDLNADPHETTNLASSNPTKMQELKTLCWNTYNDTNPPPLPS